MHKNYSQARKKSAGAFIFIILWPERNMHHHFAILFHSMLRDKIIRTK